MKFKYYNTLLSERIAEVEFIESENTIYVRRLWENDSYNYTNNELFKLFCNSVKGTYDKGVNIAEPEIFIEGVVIDRDVQKLKNKIEKLQFIKRNIGKPLLGIE